MERKPNLQGTEAGLVVCEDTNDYVIQFSSAKEQFATRSCARCTGLLVSEWRQDGPDDQNEVFRCVQCGHRIDPVILLNQSRTTDEGSRSHKARHRQSLRTATLV